LIALAGSGAREQAIRAEAARRGLANLRILPPQPRDRLGAWLAASDLHLALMPEAALGRMEPCKVAGILAAGRPCLFVGPAQSDMARLVAGSGAGRVVPPGDAAALAAAIADLVDRPRLRAAMAANALAASGACRLDEAAPRFEAFASAVLASARQRNSGAAARPSPAAAHLADLPARAGNANG
jgi:glycosyltransferase involved in cell wall biosynthesis